MQQRKAPWLGAAAALFTAALVSASCGGSTDTAEEVETTTTETAAEPVTITVATVNNGQMKDMEQLTAEYEAQNPGVDVVFQIMEEGDLRSSVTADIASGAGQYDIVTIGSYEVPQWAANGWLTDLTPYVGTPEYDVEDIIKPVRDALSYEGQLYAVPFYGESSILMYNKEIIEAAGLTVPDRPTWQEVAEIAKKVKSDKVNGICMRGKPGWGESFAVLTTMVQTFGGNWYDMDWQAQVNSPEFTEAITFYKDLLDAAGPKDPLSYSFNECLNGMKNGDFAMWYDATSLAGLLESDDSPVKGKMGYVHAPVVKTKESGWLWAWSLAIPKTTKNVDAAADFITWATSKEYHQLVGETLDWNRVPPGSRTSTFENPNYKEAAAAYAPITLKVMSSVNPNQPGVNPQPWVGIQYVSIPEFQDVGNQVAQLVADAVAGRITVKEALDQGQVIAQKAGDAQK
jgi:sorbitol/mannitol transport system substrate-binding protein